MTLATKELINENMSKTDFVRIERGGMFTPFDRVAIKYLSKGEDVPSAWLTYAQALRDMTKDIDTKMVLEEDVGIYNISWPTLPSEE